MNSDDNWLIQLLKFKNNPFNQKYYNSLKTKDHVKNMTYVLLIGLALTPVGYIVAEIIGIIGIWLGTGLGLVVRYGFGAIFPWEFKKFIWVNKT